ncbi:NADH-quinone oxidoreductase subunit D [Myxococcota bacterium]|nr:NADH-quinone oxidoreductase subunit D [Myxococcota bacterium]MBU1383051.1 NADH-quinone oxidoreductase subunit D [Myxococcota bacterium]MBU1497612.1 NADH-quinone oxidoreductase subunit D [Myxococcota bacterium]
MYLPDGYTTLEKISENDDHILYDLFFGPNHPGMHGNFGYVLDMVGTEILKVRPNAGQLHRGFEKAMENKLWAQNISLIPRVCVPDPDPNEVAYCQAVEAIMGVDIPMRAKYIRSIVLEMSRLGSFLMGMGGVAGALGHYTTMYLMMIDRDLILDLFEALTGARVYHIYNIPGGVRRDIPEGWTDKLLALCDRLDQKLPEWDRLLYENPVVQDRLKGLGYISASEAMASGITGPSLRACGVAADVRIDTPYAAYGEIEVGINLSGGGDALARAVQVRLDFEEAVRIIRRLVAALPGGDFKLDVGNLAKLRVPAGDAYSKVESSKGEFGYYVVSNGGLKPYRVSVRGPSMPAGMYLCHKHLRGMKIDDVAVWMASFAICPPDIDR